MENEDFGFFSAVGLATMLVAASRAMGCSSIDELRLTYDETIPVDDAASFERMRSQRLLEGWVEKAPIMQLYALGGEQAAGCATTNAKAMRQWMKAAGFSAIPAELHDGEPRLHMANVVTTIERWWEPGKQTGSCFRLKHEVANAWFEVRYNSNIPAAVRIRLQSGGFAYLFQEHKRHNGIFLLREAEELVQNWDRMQVHETETMKIPEAHVPKTETDSNNLAGMIIASPTSSLRIGVSMDTVSLGCNWLGYESRQEAYAAAPRGGREAAIQGPYIVAIVKEDLVTEAAWFQP